MSARPVLPDRLAQQARRAQQALPDRLAQQARQARPGQRAQPDQQAQRDHRQANRPTGPALNANAIINSDFRINQGGYVSAAVLAAGSYGHDQWKAGASGGDYSFTQLKSSTSITIAAGKSSIQPIERTPGWPAAPTS